MKFSISETAKLTQITVRTLHYYDEIGLLSPSMISETGYRYYDELALERLQQILFYRELDFTLKEIAEIMNASNYKKEDALKRQRDLLKLKRKRLDKLINLLDANLKGDNTMSFKEFDMSAIEEAKSKYAKEVKEKWGNTEAYSQYEKMTKHYSNKDWQDIVKKSDERLKEFSAFVSKSPESKEVQDLVEKWRTFITESFYDCTKEILAGLGEMYVLDERFKKNIDKFGEGTAEFMNQAIKVYCAN